MTKKQYDEIINCQDWVKIIFREEKSHGEIILKKDLYNIKAKKIKRLFEDLNPVIIDPYYLSVEEIISLDKEIIALQRHHQSLLYSIKYALRVRDYEYEKHLKERLNEVIKRITDRRHEIEKEYEALLLSI